MGIFSKMNNTNEYNNKLETILDHKEFDTETKNLLLSMLYKIEVSYNDYHKVKTDTEIKEKFIEKLLYIIENECEDIKTVTPKTKESKQLEEIGENNIVDASKGKILVYANEKDLLFSLFALDTKFSQYKNNKNYNFDDINSKDMMMFNAIQKFIAIGEAMDASEIVRDFNGWSWNTNAKDIENINANLIYQNIMILLGNKIKNEILIPNFTNETLQINGAANAENLRNINESDDGEIIVKEEKPSAIDYINIIPKAFNGMYLSEKVEKIINYISIIILSMDLKKNEELDTKVKKIYKEKKKQIDLMQNKTLFLDEITKQKRIINDKIKIIDKTLNNRDLLTEEYDKRNSKLKDEEKIFSISHLAKILEKERENLLNELRRDNRILEPKEYIIEKENLEKQCEFYKSVLEIEEKENLSDLIKNIQVEFLKCFKIQIEQAESKSELLRLLYKFRYYCLLPINSLQVIKDVPDLKENIKDIINILLDKCIDKKILENVSNSISLCYNTLNYIFESRIIDLENTSMKVTKEKEEIITNSDGSKEKVYTILISYYDSKEEEEEHSSQVNNLLLLNTKLNKKIQLFV